MLSLPPTVIHDTVVLAARGGDRGGGWGGGGGSRGGRDLAGAFGGGGRSQMSDSQWERIEKELFGEVTAAGINFDKYDDIPTETSGQNVPDAIESFDSVDLAPEVHLFASSKPRLITRILQVAANCARAKYTKPTPVQKHSVPIVVANRDLMACAQVRWVCPHVCDYMTDRGGMTDVCTSYIINEAADMPNSTAP